MNTAFVNIWGERVGAVYWDEKQRIAHFEYHPDFNEKKWDLSPIKMPFNVGEKIFSFPELHHRSASDLNSFKGLPGLLADSLPDNYGNKLIRAWLIQNGRAADSMNSVEQLCFVGTRAMGALEFEPSRERKSYHTKSVEIDSLVKTASDILKGKEKFRSNLIDPNREEMEDILRIGTSAGGARPKAIIAYNKDSGEVRSGQSRVPSGFEHWMIKLDGVSTEQFGQSSGYGRVEMAYYLMARDCGLDIMESKLLEENGRAHFMTKRFDRADSETKHHIQTFCAMEHFEYNDVLSYSYEQLFRTMRVLHVPYTQTKQLFKRMVFNVMGRNCDDHTKNFAFRLKKDSDWELAPAYDICYAYRPDSIWVSQHALSINGKRKDFNRADILVLAQKMGIKKAEEILEQVADVIGKWMEYSKEVSVNPQLSKRIAQNHLMI